MLESHKKKGNSLYKLTISHHDRHQLDLKGKPEHNHMTLRQGRPSQAKHDRHLKVPRTGFEANSHISKIPTSLNH